MAIRVRHSENNYGGASGVPAGLQQAEQKRARLVAEEQGQQQIGLQESSLAQRAAEFASNMSLQEKRLLLSAQQNETEMRERAKNFANRISEDERKMLLDIQKAQEIQNIKSQAKSDELNLMQQAEEQQYTTAQKRKLNELNNAVDGIRTRLANGEISQEVADAQLEQVEAKRAGIGPVPYRIEQPEPTQQELFNKSVVIGEDGRRYIRDNNGRLQDLDAEADKVELEKTKAKQEAEKSEYERNEKLMDRAWEMSGASVESSVGKDGLPTKDRMAEYNKILAELRGGTAGGAVSETDGLLKALIEGTGQPDATVGEQKPPSSLDADINEGITKLANKGDITEEDMSELETQYKDVAKSSNLTPEQRDLKFKIARINAQNEDSSLPKLADTKENRDAYLAVDPLHQYRKRYEGLEANDEQIQADYDNDPYVKENGSILTKKGYKPTTTHRTYDELTISQAGEAYNKYYDSILIEKTALTVEEFEEKARKNPDFLWKYMKIKQDRKPDNMTALQKQAGLRANYSKSKGLR